MASVSLRGVSKAYPGGAGVRSIDLDLADGERLVLLGPSGSGKTTLLRLIAGLETPGAGEIRIGGVRANNLPPHRRSVGLVSQKPALYPHLTVRQHLGAANPGRERGGVGVEKNPLARARGSPESAADCLEVSHLLNRYPHQLSAGERQRVALARLLVRRPAVWLLDEPFAALDPAFRSEFRADLHLLLEQVRPTILLVTHDPIDAPALGHHVGVLGDGSLQQIGTPDELKDRPGNRFVAFSLGRFSLMDGDVVGGDPSGWHFATEDGSVVLPLPAGLAPPAGTPPTRRLTLGIRPEDIFARAPGSPPPAQPGALLTGWPVVLAEPVGSGWLLTLARHRSRVRAGWPSGPPPAVGESTDWFFAADRCHWFDAHTGRRVGGTT